MRLYQQFDVPSAEYPTIQSAVDAIRPGVDGVITLSARVYRENVVIRKKRFVTISGVGANLTVIDGHRRASVFRVEEGGFLTVQGVRIRNGNAKIKRKHIAGLGMNGCGGAFWVWSGHLILLSCIIENNRAAETGGGIYADHSYVYLSHVVIRYNQAQDSGGLRVWGNEIEMRDVTFEANKAEFVSAVCLNQCQLHAADVLCQHNRSAEKNTFRVFDSIGWARNVQLVDNDGEDNFDIELSHIFYWAEEQE